MARQAPKKPPADQVEGETIELENAVDYASLSPALEKVYAELGIEGEVQAFIAVGKLLDDGRESRVWKGAPTDYDLEALAKKFGSGDYRVRLYVQLENGRYALRSNTLIPVMLSAEDDARLRAIREGKPDPAAPAPVVGPADVARMVAEGIRAALPAVMPQQNQLGLLKEVAGIVQTMMPHHAGGAVVPQYPPINPMEVFKMAAEFARERDPIEGGRNATGMDVFMRLVDHFGPMFAQQITQQRPPNAPGGALPPQPGSVAQLPPSGDDPMMKLKAGLGFLVMQAKADNDPATYANMVLDNVPEADLRAFLAQPDPVAFLATLHAEIGTEPVRKWFGELLVEVKEIMNAPADDPAAGIDGEKKPA